MSAIQEQNAQNVSVYDPNYKPHRGTPLSKNPFRDGRKLPKADQIKCSNLLLEVAATTTIASLTEGSPVLETTSAVSYMCFLGLVWWIWGSQVLYDVRFRQKDWLHHFFILLQLLTFCALAAFAGGFDISKGLIPEDSDSSSAAFESGTQELISGSVSIQNSRSEFLALVNSTGISVVLAFSRFVILVQYFRAWSFAGLQPGRNPCVRIARAHVIAVSLSMISYIASIVVVRTDVGNASLGFSIAKVLLWVLPIFGEFTTHCIVNWDISKHFDANSGVEIWLREEAYEIIERTDTVFIILLGAGLDRITGGFQLIAGNVVLASKGALLIICAGVIFVTQLTLYFNLRKRQDGRTEHFRVLLWFFTNFFYFAALILTLQATGALLELGNLVGALDLPLSVVNTLGDAVRIRQNVTLSPDPDYTFLRDPLTKIGISLDNMMYFLNNGTQFYYGQNVLPLFDRSDPLGSMFSLVRILATVCVSTLLKNLKADPESGSTLDSRITTLLGADVTNSTSLTQRASKQAFGGIVDEVRTLHAEPADWFFGVAGATLVLQFILWWILHPDWYRLHKDDDVNRRRKPNAFERWIQGLRLSFGAASILLLIISVDNDDPPDVFSDSIRGYTFKDTTMHTLAQQGWMLLISAGIIGLEQILEQVVEAHTGRGDEPVSPEAVDSDPS